MQEYVPQSGEERLAQARVRFGERPDGTVAGGLEHARLEAELDERGREPLRTMFKDHLDPRAAREQRREGATARTG